jgi:hypothetical protein
MPASTTALVLVSSQSPAGPTMDEQASDVSPGNSFENSAGDVMLYVRNTTGSSIPLLFEADAYGAERTVLSKTIPGSGTENGVAICGPFPPSRFNDHSTTEVASNGRVFVRQGSGSDGDLVMCPFRVPRSLL